MNKKLLTWLTIGFVGLAFIFSLVGACVSAGGSGAILAMCILAMLFALAGLVCLLLLLLYKPKQPTATAKPTDTTQKEAL